MSTPDDIDLDTYAGLAAALAVPKADREAILGAHGLDEDSWEELEERWLARLQDAEDAFADDDEGVPELVQAFANAFAKAQTEHGPDVMTLQQYAEAACALQRGRDLNGVLERLAVTLPVFLRSHQHWTARTAKEPQLAAELSRLLRR